MKSVVRWAVIIDAALIVVKLVGQLLGEVLGYVISSPFRLLRAIIKPIGRLVPAIGTKGAVGLSSLITEAMGLGSRIASPFVRVGGLLEYALIIEGVVLALFLFAVLLRRLKRRSVRAGAGGDAGQGCPGQAGGKGKLSRLKEMGWS